jgi:hypothetical protein
VNVHQLPDLARGRVFATAFLAAPDAEAASLLASPEGKWFMGHGARGAYVPPLFDEALIRAVNMLCDAAPEAVGAALGIEFTK